MECISHSRMLTIPILVRKQDLYFPILNARFCETGIFSFLQQGWGGCVLTHVLLGWWSGGPDLSPGPSLLQNVSLWFVCTLASPCLNQRYGFLLSFTNLSETSMKAIRWEFTILLQELYDSVFFFFFFFSPSDPPEFNPF